MWKRVAPREGSVDRNAELAKISNSHTVAPREGSVDRNRWERRRNCAYGEVAPREGSVDRNIIHNPYITTDLVVAPREGSVDRNTGTFYHKFLMFLSLPARGAWIEIYMYIF